MRKWMAPWGVGVGYNLTQTELFNQYELFITNWNLLTIEPLGTKETPETPHSFHILLGLVLDTHGILKIGRTYMFN